MNQNYIATPFNLTVMKTYIKKIAGILVVSALLLIPAISFSQTMDTPYIDKFTNDTTLFTTDQMIAHYKNENQGIRREINVYFAKYKGQVTLHFIVKLPTDEYRRFSISAGTTILVKLADNTLLTLSTTNDAIPAAGETKNGYNCWQTDIIMALSSGDLEKLSLSAMTAIRIEVSPDNIDFDCLPNINAPVKNMISLITAAK
jgi:hypothetical protein